MSGICSKHQNHEPGCSLCEAGMADLRQEFASFIEHHEAQTEDWKDEKIAIEAQLQAERISVNELSLANQALVDRLKQAKVIQDRVNKGEVWYWQGDEYDAPATLSCPVIVDPETIRELVDARDRIKRAEEALDSILCLAAEGPEVMRSLEVLEAIIKVGLKGLGKEKP